MLSIKRIYFLIAFLLCLSTSTAFADSGDNKLDSLKRLYYNSKQNNVAANLAGDIAKEYTHEDQYDSAIYYANLGIKIAKQGNLNNVLGQLLRTLGNVYNAIGDYKMASSKYKEALQITDTVNNKIDAGKLLNNLGTVAERTGDFTNAFKYFNRALTLFTEINSKKDISTSYNNIALIYHDEDNNVKAIEYDLKALKIEEEINDIYVQANTLNNIGGIYKNEKDYTQAINYYTRAAQDYEKLKSKRGIASIYSNIGLVFEEQGNYDKALEYFNLALPVAQEIGAKRDMAEYYSNIGGLYFRKKDMKQALEYDLKALEIDKNIGDKEGTAETMDDIGTVQFALGNYAEALKSEEEALTIAKTVKSPELLSQIHHHLSDVYQKTKQTDKAFESFRVYVALRDSLNEEESSRKIMKSQMAYQFEKEQQASALEQEKKDAIANANARREKAILWFVIGILILVLLFAAFMVNRFIVIRKQKKTIEEQKTEVEQQSKIIEEKNKDITDSINYARDIQRALLPASAEVKSMFPESFVVYMPKDIVSGDFYWMVEKDGRAFLLAADCTGHGVPGALMSMIGVSLFNEAVEKKDITEAGDILNEVRKGIIQTFRQKGESQHKDGMDAALCCIDRNTLTAEFAGAYNPLWLISAKGEMKEIAADKQPIGIQDGQKPTFETRKLQLEKGDTLYLFTDGFADQFGGPNGKKFKYKQFQEKLMAIVNLGMEKQKQELENVFQQWKGSLEQVDDVLIIGVRI